MRRKWLTRKEANELCAEYQYLAGQVNVKNGLEETITCVAVAPHDEMNKTFFLSYYLETRDQHEALSFYLHPYFDVVLILKQPNNLGGSYYSLKNLVHYFSE